MRDMFERGKVFRGEAFSFRRAGGKVRGRGVRSLMRNDPGHCAGIRLGGLGRSCRH